MCDISTSLSVYELIQVLSLYDADLQVALEDMTGQCWPLESVAYRAKHDVLALLPGVTPYLPDQDEWYQRPGGWEEA